MSERRQDYEHGYTCSEVVEIAAEYVDGALTGDEMTRFELHLNFCDGCFTFIDQIRTAAAMAARVSEEQLPDETRTKLIAAFRDWKRE
jgi:predicted anti-sigma-YlaC factor YlaD